MNFSNNGVLIPTTKIATPIKSALVVMAGPTFLRTYAPYALLRPAKTTSSHSFLNIFNFEPNMLCFFRVLIIDSIAGKKLNLCCSNITYHVLLRINDLHLVENIHQVPITRFITWSNNNYQPFIMISSYLRNS